MDLGEWIVGVRSNDAEVVAWLRRALAPMLVDIDVFPNLSVQVGAAFPGTRERHTLSRRGYSVMRTSSVGRLLRGALRHLDAFVAPPEGLVPLRAELLVGDAGAVLATPGFVATDVPERRLARLGYRRGDGVPLLLDPETLEIVVPEPTLSVAPDALAELDARWPEPPGAGPVPPGRFPVRVLALLGPFDPDAPVAAASPARRLARLATFVDPPHERLLGAHVRAIARLAAEAEVVEAIGFDVPDLARLLRAVRA